MQTPQHPPASLPRASPSQASPTKATPTKPPVLKALPTVRDHTTDQLNPEGDEYVPREFDDQGEKKVAPNGALSDGRAYKCRTFWVPERGDRLFMLATECARVLGYRDSYLLFNKNRSLHKIIASQAEKDHLIQQDILPYSYRSRQIAIVTAKSMFRQFGSRLIVNGRRVRDDYWEAKAIKQGFTVEDPAGEKRPGAHRQRIEQEAAEAGTRVPIPQGLPQGQIIYNPVGNDQRPRTEIVDDNTMYIFNSGHSTSQTYQDRSATSSAHDIVSQATSASQFNRELGQARVHRTKYLGDIWNRPQNPHPPEPEQDPEHTTTSSQAVHSPHLATAGGGQQNMMSHPPQAQNPMMAQTYSQQPGPASMMAQSPVRAMHPAMNAGQMPQRSPSVSGVQHQQAGYYQPNQMWPPNQPQPSPVAQQHQGLQYGQHMASPSPHLQHSPMHAPPQLHHQSSSGSMHGSAMGYPGMQSPAYANMHQRQQMYQPSPSPQQQHYMQTAATTQPGMQSWAPGPPQPGQQGQPGWQY